MTAPQREEQLRRLMVELRLMKGSAEILQRRFELLQAALADLRVAEASLKGVRELAAGKPILVPLGGGAFVNANLGDLSRVIVGIGADISMEMGLDEAVGDVSARLAEVEKAALSVQQQLEQIEAQITLHEDAINRLASALRG